MISVTALLNQKVTNFTSFQIKTKIYLNLTFSKIRKKITKVLNKMNYKTSKGWEPLELSLVFNPDPSQLSLLHNNISTLS